MLQLIDHPERAAIIVLKSQVPFVLDKLYHGNGGPITVGGQEYDLLRLFPLIPEDGIEYSPCGKRAIGALSAFVRFKGFQRNRWRHCLECGQRQLLAGPALIQVSELNISGT